MFAFSQTRTITYAAIEDLQKTSTESILQHINHPKDALNDARDKANRSLAWGIEAAFSSGESIGWPLVILRIQTSTVEILLPPRTRRSTIVS